MFIIFKFTFQLIFLYHSAFLVIKTDYKCIQNLSTANLKKYFEYIQNKY